jgi:hypothetical protein
LNGGETLLNDETLHCLYCQRSANEVPLLNLRYRGTETWICAQHLPILIHKPGQLADKLPGLEKIDPPEHEH